MISEVVRCAEDGCCDSAYYEHANQREAQEARQRRASHPYRCLRHTKPDQVLAESNPLRVGVLTVHEESYGRFWHAEGEQMGSGSASGPGFRAFAKDFPPGTRLVVTARVELPEAGSGVVSP